MLSIILVTVSVISLALSLPINILRTEPEFPTDEVVYLPYDINYFPITVRKHNEEYPKRADLHTENPDSNDKRLSSLGDRDSTSETVVDLVIEDKVEFTTDLPSKFENKYESDLTKSPEKFVLVPVSVLKKLKQEESEVVSSSKKHVIAKRQAPGNAIIVYRPLIQFRRVSENRRRVFRRPALVGYLNDYDHFPTVA